MVPSLTQVREKVLSHGLFSIPITFVAALRRAYLHQKEGVFALS